MAVKADGKTGMIMASLMGALALSGCVSDDTMSTIMVSPGKFILYTCPELITQGRTMAARQRQLESLMAKARQGTGGEFVNAVAYREEYLVNLGEMKDLRAQAKEKDCVLPDLYTAPPPGVQPDTTQPPQPGKKRRS
jgi:outer membrane murein-binding lipoprotein Lpp